MNQISGSQEKLKNETNSLDITKLVSANQNARISYGTDFKDYFKNHNARSLENKGLDYQIRNSKNTAKDSGSKNDISKKTDNDNKGVSADNSVNNKPAATKNGKNCGNNDNVKDDKTQKIDKKDLNINKTDNNKLDETKVSDLEEKLSSDEKADYDEMMSILQSFIEMLGLKVEKNIQEGNFLTKEDIEDMISGKYFKKLYALAEKGILPSEILKSLKNLEKLIEQMKLPDFSNLNQEEFKSTLSDTIAELKDDLENLKKTGVFAGKDESIPMFGKNKTVNNSSETKTTLEESINLLKNTDLDENELVGSVNAKDVNFQNKQMNSNPQDYHNFEYKNLAFSNNVDIKIDLSPKMTAAIDNAQEFMTKIENYSKIIDEIRIAQLHDKKIINLKLEPASLGKLTVKLSSEQGVLNAFFVVDNDKAKAALELQMQQLKDALTTQGVNISNISVQVGKGTEDFNLHKNILEAMNYSKNLDFDDNNEEEDVFNPYLEDDILNIVI